MVVTSFSVESGLTGAEAASIRIYDASGVNRGDMKDARSTIDANWFEKVSNAPHERSTSYIVLKRVFDIIASSFIILVCAIPGMFLALLIACSTGGSPIYSQTRVGRYGELFNIYKLRTMVVDSDNLEKYFSSEQLEIWYRERKVDNDPRITRLGKLLRATSMDELPNFINVFLGQMTTVGPRAICEDELKWYGGRASELLSVSPGITGWWQVTERNRATYESGRRQELELHYVRNSGIGMDTRIIWATLWTIMKRTGK